MNKKNIIAGIDIGSYAIKTVIAQAPAEESVWRVLGASSILSKGVRKGVVVDPEETAKAIKESLQIAQQMSDIKPNKFWVSVTSHNIEMRQAKGVVAIGRSDGEVTKNDLERVLESSRNTLSVSNREIIHSFPSSYRLDDQENIKDPLGMKGVRLELQAISIEGPINQIKNLIKSVQQTKIEPDGLALNSLAASEVILDKQQKELGVVLIDIGATTTSLIIFEEGEIVYIASIPIGSGHITNDIAIGLRTSIETAEKIKLKYGNAFSKEVSKKEEIDLSEVDSNESESVSRYHVSEIIEARLEEIFELINKELKKAGKASLLPAGAVLVGGGAQLPQIVEFTKEKLRLPVQLGYPHSLGGVLDKVDETSFAVALGLIMWGNKTEGKIENSQNVFWDKILNRDNELWNKLKDWSKKFLP